MERWRLGYDEYFSLPVDVEQDMLLVMEVEGEVMAAKVAARSK